MNKELEKINQDIEKAQSRLRRARHEKEILEHQVKILNRKERTHRLCTRGAMLERYIPNPDTITNEQVDMILNNLFHQTNAKQIIEIILAYSENQKEDFK